MENKYKSKSMDNTDVQQQINSLDKRLAVLEEMMRKTNTSIPGAGHEKKMSLREFLISKKPSDDVKRTLTIGYYLEKFSGFSSFNVNDLLNYYEKAKEKKPTNINDKVNMNIKNGHMDESSEKKDNKKAWYLTNSGELYVENNFKA